MQGRRGMKMSDDLDATILLPFAITVMEFEPIRGEGIAQVRCKAFDLSVVVAGEKNYVALLAQTRDQREEFAGAVFIMNEIAQQNQGGRMIIVKQLAQSGFDRFHSPKRDETPGHALAQLEAKV